MQMGQLTQAFRFLREIFDLTELPLTQAFKSQKINTPQEFWTYLGATAIFSIGYIHAVLGAH